MNFMGAIEKAGPETKKPYRIPIGLSAVIGTG
jgi:hypothetical protein